jgi:hypothetical protein
MTVVLGPLELSNTWRRHGEYAVGEHVSLRFSDQFFTAEVLAVEPDVEQPARDLVILASIERLAT